MILIYSFRFNVFNGSSFNQKERTSNLFLKRINFYFDYLNYKIEHMNRIRRMMSSDQNDYNSRTNDDPSQDWVCFKCNNLNFSFRTKCNRCKVQSREDNQQLLYADYYYYNQYYGYQPTEQTSHFKLSDNVVPFIEGIQSPQKKACVSDS